MSEKPDALLLSGTIQQFRHFALMGCFVIFVTDFDGTLAVCDTVDTLLEAYASPEWVVIENAWLAGNITAIECMKQQLRLVTADHITLEKFFHGIQLDASFLAFFRYVSPFAKIAIVSDGLDHAIEVATRAADIPSIPVYANKLHFVPDGLDISFPHRSTSCSVGSGVCKCAVASELSVSSGGPIILIGDGKSDHCLAKKADVVFAKSSLARYCEQENIVFHRFQTFADVLKIVRQWPQSAPKQATALRSIGG